MEANPPAPPVIAKKLSNAVRLIMFMIRKGVWKKKLMPDLNVMMERGKIIGKSFNDLMIRHNTALGCSSHDVHMSYVSPSPRDYYEFSCSNSTDHPPYVPFFTTKRSRSRYYGSTAAHHATRAVQGCVPRCHETAAIDSVKVIRGRRRRRHVAPVDDSSPDPWVKIADSPPPLSLRHDFDDEDCHVDEAAEEFIERFYRELMLQKWMAARETTDWYG